MTPIVKGPRDAKILIVGEAPGEEEMRHKRPFVGNSGKLLDTLLTENKIDPESVRVTNVCHVRPPDNDIELFMPKAKKDAAGLEFRHGRFYNTEIRLGLELLRAEVNMMPNLEMIIGVGNLPLWAIQGENGITKWRGSQLFSKCLDRPVPFVPTLHPAFILRLWENRWVSKLDYKRARLWYESGFKTPRYDFIVRPSHARVVDWLRDLLHRLAKQETALSVDTETRNGHIACVGLGYRSSAICIPLLHMGGSYWTLEEEVQVWLLLYKVLTHKNCFVIGQNFNYDNQYFARRAGFKANLRADTMIMQHLCFPGAPKGLDFISSIHNDFHVYWKDESKEWDPKLGEEQLWLYNCKDVCATYEAWEHLTNVVRDFGLAEQLKEQMEMNEIALEMMYRGILVDKERKKRVHEELTMELCSLAEFCNNLLGVKFDRDLYLKEIDYDSAKQHYNGFNPASSKQVQDLAYRVLNLPLITKHGPDGDRPTADKEAIKEWCDKAEPLFRPLLRGIADYRSLQVYRSTFAGADLDVDGRWRCSIKVAGPNTFRWATAEDAFGFGTNMQNIPSGTEDD